MDPAAEEKDVFRSVLSCKNMSYGRHGVSH